MKALIKLLIAFFPVIVLIASCKKAVQVDPPVDELLAKNVFANPATAFSALTGVYSNLMTTEYGISNSGITIYTGMTGDELRNFSSTGYRQEFFTNSITPTNTEIGVLWRDGYKNIYAANAILEGIENSPVLSDAVKKQIKGEAKFIRAFLHFYLMSLYGNIPLILGTDYRMNSIAGGNSRAEIFASILADLSEAQNLLEEDYITADRVRPNKNAATALLARVYLYMGDWQNAEANATTIIDKSSVYSLESNLDNVFLPSSQEAIWQLYPVLPQRNTNEGFYLILTGTPTLVSLTDTLMNSFEMGDLRKDAWTKSISVGSNIYYYPHKYKIKSSGSISEYYMVLRLAEQFLIRAEARTKLGKVSGAQSDLNTIRTRAGLAPSSANDESSLMGAIVQERKIEFFAEWGHRWFDLKRYNLIGTVLPGIKLNNWQPTDSLFPLPQAQIANDVNSAQNPGY